MPFIKGHKINSGRIFSKERNSRISNARMGIKFSKKTLSKMRKAKIGMKGFWKGKNLTKETIEKLKLAHIGKPMIKTRGKNHHNWKGGATSTNRKLRDSLEYKIWRRAVFERDNYTCVWCKVKGGILHADHIKRFSDYPELRFAIDNGRTLCIVCHRTTDTWGNKKI